MPSTHRALCLLGALLFVACDDSAPNTTVFDAGGDATSSDTASGDATSGDATSGDSTSGDSTSDGGGDVRSCLAGQTPCGDDCCEANEACSDGVLCTRVCIDQRPACELGQACCTSGEECVLDTCVTRCDTERCGAEQLCCAANEICDAGACVLACPSGITCGPEDTCCTSQEICFADTCVSPGNTCQGNSDCEVGQYCEPTNSTCLPQDVLPGCQYIPSQSFDPVIEWSWEGSSVQPEYTRVMSSPIVVNLTDDNGDGAINTFDVPEVVFTTYRRGSTGYWNDPGSGGWIRVVSGDSGEELNTFTSQRVMPNAGIATGDVDNDRIPEILAISSTRELVIFDHLGNVQDTIPGVVMGTWNADAIALGDLDQDGIPEAVIGLQVFSLKESRILWDAASTGCARGSNGNRASITLLADMDLDPQRTLEVVTSSCVLDGETGAVLHRAATPVEGFTAAGNFDDDPNPEIVVTSSGRTILYDHDFSQRLFDIDVPGSGIVGPPTVSNFDEDPEPEIAVAGGAYYVIIDTNGDIAWQSATKDTSSGITGSSIFDFEGDGIAEPVYNDECFIHIYDTRYEGTDPRSEKWKFSNTSWTVIEYPLIADVDNDGNAEIVAVRNADSSSPGSGCDADYSAADGLGDGVRIIGDANDNWVSSRRIWNQHTYHITNVNENSNIPVAEQRNTTLFNNFRQNSQGEGGFNAPDLIGEQVNARGCPAVTFNVTVTNDGALGVGPGLPVAVYRVLDEAGTRELLAVGETTTSLLPGASEIVEVTWEGPGDIVNQTLDVVIVVDDRGDGTGTNNECLEDNNTISFEYFCAID